MSVVRLGKSLRWKQLGSLGLLAVVTAVATPALAQPAGGGGGRGGQDFEQRRQERQAAEARRLQESLQLSAEEFALIQPKIEAIRQLSREAQVIGRGGPALGGRRGEGGPGRPGGPQAGAQGGRQGGPEGGRGGAGGGWAGELSEPGKVVQAAATKLQGALGDASSSPEAVKVALNELREARQALLRAQSRAQDELRELLTARQEAALVLQGVLE